MSNDNSRFARFVLVLTWIISTIWMFREFQEESILAFLASTAAVVAVFYTRKKTSEKSIGPGEMKKENISVTTEPPTLFPSKAETQLMDHTSNLDVHQPPASNATYIKAAFYGALSLRYALWGLFSLPTIIGPIFFWPLAIYYFLKAYQLKHL